MINKRRDELEKIDQIEREIDEERIREEEKRIRDHQLNFLADLEDNSEGLRNATLKAIENDTESNNAFISELFRLKLEFF